jgi:hypothetical protein
LGPYAQLDLMMTNCLFLGFECMELAVETTTRGNKKSIKKERKEKSNCFNSLYVIHISRNIVFEFWVLILELDPNHTKKLIYPISVLSIYKACQ